MRPMILLLSFVTSVIFGEMYLLGLDRIMTIILASCLIGLFILSEKLEQKNKTMRNKRK